MQHLVGRAAAAAAGLARVGIDPDFGAFRHGGGGRRRRALRRAAPRRGHKRHRAPASRVVPVLDLATAAAESAGHSGLACERLDRTRKDGHLLGRHLQKAAGVAVCADSLDELGFLYTQRRLVAHWRHAQR